MTGPQLLMVVSIFLILGGVIVGGIALFLLARTPTKHSDYLMGLNNGRGSIQVRVTNRKWIDIRLTQTDTSSMSYKAIPIRITLGTILDLLVSLENQRDFRCQDILKFKGEPHHEFTGNFSDEGLQLYITELSGTWQAVVLNLDEQDQRAFFRYLLESAQDMTAET